MYDLIIYIIVLATGFLLGFINTIAGSGSLLTLPLLMWLGLDPLMANGTNRLVILMQGITGTALFARKKQYHYRHDMQYLLPAVLGSIPGAFIAVNLNESIMNKAIAVVMLAILVIMVINPQKRLQKYSVKGPGRSILFMFIFFFIGIYGGFVQAGVGILMLAAFSLSNETSLLRTNALKIIITTIFTIAVVPVFIIHKQVDYFYGILMGAGSVAGTWFSTKLAFKHGNPFLKVVLYIVILASAAYLIIKSSNYN